MGDGRDAREEGCVCGVIGPPTALQKLEEWDNVPVWRGSKTEDRQEPFTRFCGGSNRFGLGLKDENQETETLKAYWFLNA